MCLNEPFIQRKGEHVAQDRQAAIDRSTSHFLPSFDLGWRFGRSVDEIRGLLTLQRKLVDALVEYSGNPKDLEPIPWDAKRDEATIGEYLKLLRDGYFEVTLEELADLDTDDKFKLFGEYSGTAAMTTLGPIGVSDLSNRKD